ELLFHDRIGVNDSLAEPPPHAEREAPAHLEYLNLPLRAGRLEQGKIRQRLRPARQHTDEPTSILSRGCGLERLARHELHELPRRTDGEIGCDRGPPQET